nr:reverse transcriptase domain-containing protein [Tanacetum cinerariifolium]
MSTRSSVRNLFPPLDNPELTIQRRSRADPTLLNDFEMTTEGNGDPPVPDLRTMEELCQPSLNRRGGTFTKRRPEECYDLIENLTSHHNDCDTSSQRRGTFMKRCPEECYDLIKNMTAHHNDWDTSAQQSESSSSITSSFDLEIVALKAKMAEINKNLYMIHISSIPKLCILVSSSILHLLHVLAKMFLGKYFPPSMVTKLRNEITNFRQRLDELLFKAWECYKLSIDRCGTFMKRRPEECYDLIENLTAHHNDCDTSSQWSESSSSITFSFDPKIVALKAEMAKINKNLMRVLQVNQQVKVVTPNRETCGGPHSYTDCPATVGQTQNVYAAGAYQGGNSYEAQGPTIPTTSSSLPPLVERETEVTKDKMHPTNIRSTKDVQPPVVQAKNPILNSEPIVTPIIEPVVAPVSAPKPNQKPLILYPSRLHDQKLSDKANDQKDKFFQIFQDLNFNISFADALILMPNPGRSRRKHKSHAIISVEQLFLPELSPTCMTLKLADRSISRPVGVAEDVFVKVGTFHFPADFVVIDFDADPRVPLILGRSFLKTERALIDVFEGELTLRVGKEAITFNLDKTLRYSANYNDMTANRIDVIDMACEEHSQEVLGFSDVIASGNPTPYYDLIVSTSSPTLTPSGDSDFLLEEVDAFLALEDDPTSPEVHHSYFNTEGDIILLEPFLNDDPSLPPPNQGNYFTQVRKEPKICEAKTDKSSIVEPPEVELKDLPPHLEYAFLEGDDKLPVIIAKDLSDGEKTALIKVLKSHKQAIAWKLSDIKGINPEFCTYKILMENDPKPAVQHERRVNPKVHNAIKKEVLKLLDAGLIYPISDSPWVSLVHYVPKKDGFTVVENEENELILTQHSNQRALGTFLSIFALSIPLYTFLGHKLISLFWLITAYL